MKHFNYDDLDDCFFQLAEYAENGNTALSIMSESEGPIATCTVNLDKLPSSDLAAIKNYSENAGMDQFLARLKVITEQVHNINSGYVTIPIYRLDLEEIAKYTYKGDE